MNVPIFELCAASLSAIRAAEVWGVDRVELCSEMSIGGITPDPRLVEAAVHFLSIPLYVMIRPRGGNFAFTTDEFSIMCGQIESAKKAGAHGVVLGVLLPSGCVDEERSRTLVELARPMKVTFHRAFDETPDLSEALEAVISTGADCLLTSGGSADALSGAESIARLVTQASGRIEIMAGGGLHADNLVEVLRRTGTTKVHASLTRKHNGSASTKSIEPLDADIRRAVALLREERVKWVAIGSDLRPSRHLRRQ
jgi:copper homeostasis protein